MRKTGTALIAAGLCLATPALAETCPAEAEGKPGDLSGPPANANVDISLLESVTFDTIPGHEGKVILRKVVIQPGGVIRLHDHAGIQGFAYLLSGTALEHRSDCAVPILREPGDVASEHAALTHWWINEGVEPAVLLVSHVPGEAE